MSATNKALHILDRSEWQGEPPSGKYLHLKLPVSNVIIHHTATEGCVDEVSYLGYYLYIRIFE